MKSKYRIAWCINGYSGHGEYLFDRETAIAWVQKLNKEHGHGTHWIESQ